MRALTVILIITLYNFYINIDLNKCMKNVVPIPEVSESKQFTRISNPLDIQLVSDRVLNSIVKVKARQMYCIGKGDKQLYLGPILQIIPIGGFVQICDGMSVFIPKPSLNGNEFQFNKDKQIAIRVGNNVLKDFVVIVGSNGCILLESTSYVTLDMPVFVVEQTGEYYYVNRGKRLLNLGTGGHLILYTKQTPILLIRICKTNKFRDQVMKIDSTLSNKPLEELTEERKNMNTDLDQSFKQ